MDNSTVIRDAGLTLKRLFARRISDFLKEEDIVFESPGDLQAGDVNQLSIFLFQISPNPFLRNQTQEPIGDDKMRFAPAIVDLKYLFTPYAPKRETELIIIERILQLFHDQSVMLSGNELEGCLSESGNDPIHVEPADLSLDDLNKLWGVFPNKSFKLSICFVLSAMKIPSARTDRSISRVVEREIDIYRKEHP